MKLNFANHEKVKFSILDEIQSKCTIVTWINHELKFDPYCCSVLQIDLKSVCSTLQQVSIELFQSNRLKNSHFNTYIESRLRYRFFSLKMYWSGNKYIGIQTFKRTKVNLLEFQNKRKKSSKDVCCCNLPSSKIIWLYGWFIALFSFFLDFS